MKIRGETAAMVAIAVTNCAVIALGSWGLAAASMAGLGLAIWLYWRAARARQDLWQLRHAEAYRHALAEACEARSTGTTDGLDEVHIGGQR